jgi:toxin ParE1/3/4
MTGLYWTEDASDVLNAALEYTARSSLRAALAQLAEIQKQTSRLVTHPHLGRPGRRKNTRELSINRTPFVVTYRIIGDNIQILHFRHTSRRS